MGQVEFDVGDGSAGNRSRVERGQSALPWFVLLAVLLIAAGSGLAQQTTLPAFVYHLDSEGRYVIEDADGGVITWSWRGDQDPDDRTIERISAGLSRVISEREWTCRLTDHPDAPAAPSPMPDDLEGFTVCDGWSNCPEASQVSASPQRQCASTATTWIPPEGWEPSTDSATAAN